MHPLSFLRLEPEQLLAQARQVHANLEHQAWPAAQGWAALIEKSLHTLEQAQQTETALRAQHQEALRDLGSEEDSVCQMVMALANDAVSLGLPTTQLMHALDVVTLQGAVRLERMEALAEHTRGWAVPAAQKRTHMWEQRAKHLHKLEEGWQRAHTAWMESHSAHQVARAALVRTLVCAARSLGGVLSADQLEQLWAPRVAQGT
jgi:hypothetical protein